MERLVNACKKIILLMLREVNTFGHKLSFLNKDFVLKSKSEVWWATKEV